MSWDNHSGDGAQGTGPWLELHRTARKTDTEMTIAPNRDRHRRPAGEIEYPVRDGKPVGETDAHVDLTLIGKDVLRNFFRDRPDVYVSGNNFIYFEEGNPRARVSPDGYVVFGVPMRQRDCYKTWEEGGKLPAVVFEYTSRSTRREDQTSKRTLYEERLRVPEYFMFDPKGEYLRPRLQGYRLLGGVYVPLELTDNRLRSEQLGIILAMEDISLRFYDAATGEKLRTLAEETAEHLAAERRADREAARAEQEAMRATQAEEELARLRAELEELKRQQAE